MQNCIEYKAHGVGMLDPDRHAGYYITCWLCGAELYEGTDYGDNQGHPVCESCIDEKISEMSFSDKTTALGYKYCRVTKDEE